MDQEIAIEVEELSKLYYLEGRRPRGRRFRDFLRRSTARRPCAKAAIARELDVGHAFWALQNVSFTVRRGEVLGIIGRNGAGKSTLLKIMSRITAPTSGCARLRGRVISLLEVGTGFHEELTGRENVYLNGSILGMTSDEITRKLDAIVEFSGISRFLDTPVKYYSSGMRVRLGFSVAAHIDPEILIIDEVLAVGDAAFQEKCLGRVNELTGDAQHTVIFVSHSMAAIGSLCTRTILLDGGSVIADGDTGDVIKRYHELSAGEKGTVELSKRRERSGSGQLRMTKVVLQDANGANISYAKSGDAVRLVVEYDAAPELVGTRNIIANIVISTANGMRLFGLPSDILRKTKATIRPSGRLTCSLDKLPLLPGHYGLDISIVVERELADKVMGAAAITIVEGDYFGTQLLPISHYGNVLVGYDWNLHEGTH